MKYNRLTERRERRKSIRRWWTNDGESLKMYKRLAKLEDKIEAGKLISTVQNEQGEQEIEFFVKHNAEVRKEVVKECLQVLRDTRIACIYDDYSWGWNKGIDQAIEQLAKIYCINIDAEVEKRR